MADRRVEVKPVLYNGHVPHYGPATRKVLFFVEYQCGVPVERFLKGRTSADNRTRHIAIWLLRTTFDLDTKQLMRIFGLSYDNILSSIHGIRMKRQSSAQFALLTNHIERTAKETFGLKRVMKSTLKNC